MRVRNLSKCLYAAEGNSFEANPELGASRTLMTSAGWECRGRGPGLGLPREDTPGSLLSPPLPATTCKPLVKFCHLVSLV